MQIALVDGTELVLDEIVSIPGSEIPDQKITYLRFVGVLGGTIKMFFEGPAVTKEGDGVLGIYGYEIDVDGDPYMEARTIREQARRIQGLPDDGEDAGMLTRDGEVHIARYDAEDMHGPVVVYVTNHCIYVVRDGHELEAIVYFAQISGIEYDGRALRVSWNIPVMDAKTQKRRFVETSAVLKCGPDACGVMKGVLAAFKKGFVRAG